MSTRTNEIKDVIKTDSSKCTSLFDKMSDDDDAAELIDFVEDNDLYVNPEESFFVKNEMDLVANYINKLNSRDQFIFKNAFGFECESKSLREIAEALNNKLTFQAIGYRAKKMKSEIQELAA